MSKSVKLILILLVGLGLIGFLSFLSVNVIFKDIGGENSVVMDMMEYNRDTVSSGSAGVDAVPSPDSSTKDMMPIYNTYDGTGDGSKLVKTAYVSMSVTDFDKTVEEIKTKVLEYKGYVINLRDTGVDNKRNVTLSVRIPSDKFDSTVSLVKSLGVEVTSSSENTDDISSVYQDLQARLKNQRAYEKQLLGILDKATKVSDVLNIQKEVSQVRQEIELMESQIKSFDTQVAMSVITITMTKASEALNVVGETWKPQGVFAEALTALISFGKGLATLLIWIVVFSPIILIPYGIYYLVKRNKKA